MIGTRTCVKVRRVESRPEQPKNHCTSYRDAKHEAFVRTAVGHQSQSQAHKNGISRSAMFLNPRERPQHQCPAQRDYGCAPISVHPIAQNAQPQYCQHSAKQSPRWRQPPLQRPAQSRAHRGRDQQLSDPRMPQQLPHRKHQSLRRWVHRHIRGMLNDVEALEVNPHRMCGIRDLSVRERVRR